MKLRFSYRTIRQSHGRDPLSLTPTPMSVELAKAGEFANGRTSRERFRVCNLAKNLEKHKGGAY